MPNTDKASALVAMAEQAAAAGDYASAERFLRTALEEQESSLGLAHPDLANTLNNLGVVCDMADRVDEAEQCYRRAHAIAAAALPSDHPFVATSRRNLEDFCAARGRPMDLRVPPSVPAPVAPGTLLRPLAFAAVGVCAFAFLIVIVAARPWLESEGSSEAAVAAPVKPADAPASPAPARTRVEPRPATVPEHRAVAASAPAAPTVVNVLLCTALTTGADWHCDQAGSTVDPGPLSFYSRLRSPRDTTVLHRWYRDDRLQQEMTLNVAANSGAGYRVYSRKTMSVDSAGDWRVELRTADGQLLHEARFTVR